MSETTNIDFNELDILLSKTYPNYNSEEMQQKRDIIVESLFDNPCDFFKYLYVSNGKINSAFLESNNPDFCCLLENVNLTKLNQQSYDESICGKIRNQGGEVKVNKLAEQGKTGTVYLVEGLGVYSDNVKYILKQRILGENIGTKFKQRMDFPFVELGLKNNYWERQCSTLSPDQYSLFSNDEFTNEFIIAMILEYYFRKKWDYVPVINYYTVSLCERKRIENKGGLKSKENTIGFYLLEYGDKGDLSNFSKKLDRYIIRTGLKNYANPIFVLNIFLQVLTTLHFLQKNAYFSHGDLKSANIFLKEETVNYTYEDITINFDIGVKIGDFGQSSMNIKTKDNVYHLYNRGNSLTKVSKGYSRRVPYRVEIKYDDGFEYYKLPDEINELLFTRIRHLGLPFYNSFDTYTFIVSFLSIPEVYNTVFEKDILLSYIDNEPFDNEIFSNILNLLNILLWDELWLPEDKNKMKKKLKKLSQNKKPAGFNDVLTFLKNKYLKCDLTNILLNKVKSNLS